MKKNGLKSILLSVLIVGSVYQIIMLWFDNSSDRNFFYNFIEVVVEQGNTQSQESSRLNLLKPRTIGVYLGTASQDFNVIKYTNADFSTLYEQGIQVVTSVLSKGSLFEKLNVDDELWDERGILFIYDTVWTKELLTETLGLDKATLNGIDKITSIGIIPAKSNSGYIKAYIVSESGKIYCYRWKKDNLEEENSSFNKILDAMEISENPPYISTMKDDIKLFDANILIPLRSTSIAFVEKISFSKPFIQQNSMDKEALEIYINGFFSNPDVKWSIEYSDKMIYGDNKVMVKYNEDAILEYTSIDQGKTIESDPVTAYSIAEQFLIHDMLIRNQNYYLMDYNDSGNSITFNFGYTYDNFPLYIHEEILSQNNMTAPMRITVSNGKVTKYKRFLLEPLINEGEKNTLKSMFYDVLDVFLTTQHYGEGDIEDMFLGYVYSDTREASLMWVLETKDDFYTLNLE